MSSEQHVSLNEYRRPLHRRLPPRLRQPNQIQLSLSQSTIGSTATDEISFFRTFWLLL